MTGRSERWFSEENRPTRDEIAHAMGALGSWLGEAGTALPSVDDELVIKDSLARMESALLALTVAIRRSGNRPDSAWMAEAIEEYAVQAVVLDTYGPSAL